VMPPVEVTSVVVKGVVVEVVSFGSMKYGFSSMHPKAAEHNAMSGKQRRI
jgi:hypothetical protein